MECDWTEAQALFDRLDQSQIDRIKFKTRSLREGEACREWANVPSKLSAYIKSVENKKKTVGP